MWQSFKKLDRNSKVENHNKGHADLMRSSPEQFLLRRRNEQQI